MRFQFYIYLQSADLKKSSFSFYVFLSMRTHMLRNAVFWLYNQPSLHSQEFFDGIKDSPESWKYWMQGPFETAEEFTESFVEEIMHKDPSKVLFAIIDKTSES